MDSKLNWQILVGGVIGGGSIVFWAVGLLWLRSDLEERGIPLGYALACGIALSMCLIAWGFIKKNRALRIGRGDRIDTLKQLYRDVKGQLRYISDPHDVGNVRVNLGQSIRDHIDGDMFLGWQHRVKLRTRVNAIATSQYDWRKEYPDVTATDAIFRIYIKVLEQDEDPSFTIDQNIAQPLQRIEAGIRAMLAAIETAVARLGGKLEQELRD